MGVSRRISGSNWRLDADPEAIDNAADDWRTLSKALDDTLGDRITVCKPIADDWEGDDADSWREHNSLYRTDLQDIIDECEATAVRVGNIAALIRSHQGYLDRALDELLSRIPHHGTGRTSKWYPTIEFIVENESQDTVISAALSEAAQIRGQFADEMSLVKTDLDNAVTNFNALLRTWIRASDGTEQLFNTPAEADGPSIVQVGDRWIFNAGTGDNSVTVTHDPPPDGPLKIYADGQVYDIPDGVEITIRTGDGSDMVTVPPGTDVGITVLSGSGDDIVEAGGGDDRIIGGAGHDTITSRGGDDRVSAGSGDDYVETHGGNDVVTAGSGYDKVYTLGASSTISGGSGKDYIEGGQGDSFIHTGSGDDIVSGGRGDDRIIAGDGENTVYAGAGDDHVTGTGNDTVYAESGDSVQGGRHVEIEVTEPPSWIKIEGTPEFIERTQADLDMYGASPTGQEMLSGLEDHHGDLGLENNLTIKEYHEGGNTIHEFLPTGQVYNTIEYQPSYGVTYDHPPSVVLYHEMSHVHSAWNGSISGEPLGPQYGVDEGVLEAEYQASGLPYDHDHDPTTPDQLHPDQPIEVTENGMRDEMALRTRDHYNE